MIAEFVYRTLDEAGLTPPVHYHAAPYEWRLACEKIEERIRAEFDHRLLCAELRERRAAAALASNLNLKDVTK